MKRKIIIGLFAVIISILVIAIIFAISKNNVVKYYTANVEIDEYGNINVEETVVINYRSYDNYIYRDIKYQKNHSSNPLLDDVEYGLYKNDIASFDETSVDVEVWRGDIIDEFGLAKDITDQVKIGYSFNNDRDKYGNAVECYPDTYRCESIYVDATDCGSLDGLMSFVYRYKINNMVTVYDDCAELNYRLFEYFNYKVKVAAVTFTLPSSNINEEYFHGYGHGLSNGRITQYGNQSFDYIAKNVKKDDIFECRLVFPKEIISNVDADKIVHTNMEQKILSYEKQLADETNFRANIAIFVNICTFIIGGLLVIITIKVYKKYDKELTPEFDKEYLREMPSNHTPAEVGFLYYFEKTNDEDVSATLLDLVRRGFLKLEYFGSPSEENPEFKIIKNVDYLNNHVTELKEHETQLIQWFIDIIGNGMEVSINQIENFGKSYNDAQTFQKWSRHFMESVKRVCARNDWFVDKKVKNKAQSAALLPIFAFLLIASFGALFNIEFSWNLVFLGIITFAYIFYVATIKKRSKNGNELYAKWKAFKKFLEEFGNFEDYPMPGIIVWEEYLVYATTFKIADKVMEQLRVELPELQTADVQTNYQVSFFDVYLWNRHSRFLLSNSINHALSNARTNSINSIAAHNARTSGGGHGGGFSGGSSFGGGGGGFRGGR